MTGFACACAANHCALIGGETAQMPGFYRPGEYDLSGTIVGVVEKARILDGKSIRPGDAVLGLASSGLHTNGFSLARRILFGRLKLKPASFVRELDNTLGDELLKVHRSYGPLLRQLLRKFNPPAPGAPPALKGMAHITGGGFMDNIPRVLPAGCDALVRAGSWETPPIFQLLRAKGGMDEAELYQVFNMGIGMVLLVAADKADAVLRFIRAQKQAAWLIGEVVPGTGIARVI
jgi:phosphoribosylformylglycinamidine cyclo-ligase